MELQLKLDPVRICSDLFGLAALESPYYTTAPEHRGS